MEIWKDIEGFEGIYQISNQGRVKSLPKKKNNRYSFFWTKEKILKPTIISGGYYSMGLVRDKKRTHKLVNRLVAEHFIPNPDNKRTVNHKDGDRTNNNDWNLEWSTYSEQELHKRRVLHGNKRGVAHVSLNSWQSQIKNTNTNKVEYLGSFNNEENAYQAFYNRYLEIHGVKPW